VSRNAVRNVQDWRTADWCFYAVPFAQAALEWQDSDSQDWADCSHRLPLSVGPVARWYARIWKSHRETQCRSDASSSRWMCTGERCLFAYPNGCRKTELYDRWHSRTCLREWRCGERYCLLSRPMMELSWRSGRRDVNVAEVMQWQQSNLNSKFGFIARKCRGTSQARVTAQVTGSAGTGSTQRWGRWPALKRRRLERLHMMV